MVALPGRWLGGPPAPPDPVHHRRGDPADRQAPDAQETKDIGLIGHVVPAGEALTKAREIAEVINYNGPLAVEAILRTLRETETMSEEEAFAHEMTYGMAVMGSEDAKEGPRAFKEKRKPNFQRK